MMPKWRKVMELKRKPLPTSVDYANGYRDGYEGNPKTPPAMVLYKANQVLPPVAFLPSAHEWYMTGYYNGEDDSDEMYWTNAKD